MATTETPNTKSPTNNKPTTERPSDPVSMSFDELTAQYQQLEKRFVDAVGELRSSLAPTRERLRHARDRAVRSSQKLHEQDSKDVGSALDDFDTSMHDFRVALDAARHDLAVANADHLAGYRDAFLAQATNWKGRLERLSLQADLAHMDVRDDIVDLHDNYVQARRSGRSALYQAERTGSETWEAVRDRVQFEFDALGVAYSSLLSRIDPKS